MPVLSAFFHVLIVGVAIAIPVFCELFDEVAVDTNQEHYAEKPWPFLKQWLPMVRMPANTIVNSGYVAAGIWWLLLVQKYKCDYPSSMTGFDIYMLNAFSWMAVLYACVQTWRILSLDIHIAILDQWYTLPIFSWVVTWANHLLYGWSSNRILIITFCSVISYCLTLFTTVGFEIALGLHIVSALVYAHILKTHYESSEIKGTFRNAMLGCGGFVVLKLLDHVLPSVCTIFKFITGHFLSKVADIAQIHYTAKFFFLITIAKNDRRQL